MEGIKLKVLSVLFLLLTVYSSLLTAQEPAFVCEPDGQFFVSKTLLYPHFVRLKF